MSLNERDFIDLDEAREFGIIQEINRKLLHPRGLALAVDCDVEEDENGDFIVTSTNGISGILDLRDSDEGMVFCDVEQEKVEKFKDLKRAKRRDRIEEYGFVIQPPDITFEVEEEEEEQEQEQVQIGDGRLIPIEPCKECGSTETKFEERETSKWEQNYYSLVCTNCKHGVIYSNKELAVEKWNENI